MTSEVAVVVLNWHNAPDTVTCLRSLEHLNGTDHSIVAVDNGSTDGSAQVIREAFPDLLLLETGKNLGYAGGNNFGIRYALEHGARYVCILNNDVTVAPGFLTPMLAAFHQRAAAGVVTPLIAEMAAQAKTWELGNAINRQTGMVSRLHGGEPVSVLQALAPFAVDVASGAAMLVRREVFEHVGLLDEAFFLYYEETDWCTTVRRAGYEILAVPASVVWHKVSATVGQASPLTDYYMLRNHLRFITRHWSGLPRWRLLTSTILRNLLTIAAYTAKPHGGRRLPHRNARVLALRDAALGRWGQMGPDVAAVCFPNRR
ncbi:MAG: glycosyltransferase family 2 protein [Anaerolineae bacterium]|nr:glycosyltransferase family 2 protein [Anaerolineae bacterium]